MLGCCAHLQQRSFVTGCTRTYSASDTYGNQSNQDVRDAPDNCNKVEDVPRVAEIVLQTKAPIVL